MIISAFETTSADANSRSFAMVELGWIKLIVGQGVNVQHRRFVDEISIQPLSPTYRLGMTLGTILRMLG